VNDAAGCCREAHEAQSLSLEHTEVGDTGFAKLAGLTNLTELRLTAPRSVTRP
jgi:hypothetical protein